MQSPEGLEDSPFSADSLDSGPIWTIEKITPNSTLLSLTILYLWGNFMSISPVCIDKRNMTMPSVIPDKTAVLGRTQGIID